MSELEEQKKVLLPILQRAAEIETMEPKVAYYCRLYALQKALEMRKPAPEIQGLIKSLFAQCEKDKPKLKLNAEEDKLYCEGFALTVFRRADKMDRAGRADINTAKCFYAAAIFLQIMEQFLDRGEELELVAPDLVEKARYALWRAAELRKALREGRPPAPPPAADDMAAAAAAGGATGSSAGGAAPDDLFAGPALDPSEPGGLDGPGGTQPGQAAAAGDVGVASSSTDEFLNLPRPPSTIPPAGSVGLLEPAAAAGPRFRPGSMVWCAPGGGQQGPAGSGGGAAEAPQKGTVGQLISPDGGLGGQALYKVALSQAIQEFTDSQLSPALDAGARVMFVAAHGEQPEPASILAVQKDQWPCRYLLQLDNGHNLATTGGHLRLDAPVERPAAGTPHTSAGGHAAPPYPSMSLGGLGAGHVLPAAPPLVDDHPPAPVAPSPSQHVAGPAAAGRVSPPPAATPSHPQVQTHAAAAAAGARPYASSGGGSYQSAQSGGGAAPAARQQPAPPGPSAAALHHHTPAAAVAAAAALDAAVQAAAAGAFQPSASAIADAQKFSKYAASSLAFDDVAGAVKYLSDALRLLTQRPS